jgi:hypothetical protein
VEIRFDPRLHDEAGKLITAKEAERRVLVLENPGLRGQSKVTTSLFAGVQMVVPATSRRPTGTASRRCASCSKARAPIPPSTASARDGARRFRHHAVDDLARPFQRDQ